MKQENQKVNRLPRTITQILLGPLTVFALAGCAPERPETLIRDSSREGSPSVLVVSDRVTTRREIQNEIDALPFWLQTRFNSPTGEAIFARDLLIRGLIFRWASREGYEKKGGTYERYEKNVITWFLNSRAQFPPPKEKERDAYLESQDGRNNFDKRDIYVLYVASKSLADKLYDEISKAPTEERLAAFQKAVKTYSQDPNVLKNSEKSDKMKDGKGAGYLLSLTQAEYEKKRQKTTFSYLENPIYQQGITVDSDRVLYGKLGPFDLASPPWTVTTPIRDALLWKIYLLGEITTGNQQLKDGDLTQERVDEQVFAIRKKKIAEKIMRGESLN